MKFYERKVYLFFLVVIFFTMMGFSDQSDFKDNPLALSQTVKVYISPQKKMYTGKCPLKVKMTGRIEAFKAVKLMYYFQRNDGVKTISKSIELYPGKIRSLNYVWEVGADYSGWVQLVVLIHKVEIRSSKSMFKVYCDKKQPAPVQFPNSTHPPRFRQKPGTLEGGNEFAENLDQIQSNWTAIGEALRNGVLMFDALMRMTDASQGDMKMAKELKRTALEMKLKSKQKELESDKDRINAEKMAALKKMNLRMIMNKTGEMLGSLKAANAGMAKVRNNPGMSDEQRAAALRDHMDQYLKLLLKLKNSFKW